MFCSVKINNVPRTCKKKYIVARYCVMDNQLWFSGAFDDESEAKKNASVVEGVVCLNTDDIPEKTENEE